MQFKRGIKLALALGLTTVALTSCSTAKLNGFGYPKGVSSTSSTSLSLWQGAWITAGVVGVFTLILILWPVVFHRRKKGDTTSYGKQTRYNLPAEVAYTVIPFLIVAVLFYFTARDESRITKVDSVATAPHNIHVNAIQWSWQFTYDDAAAKPTVTGTPGQPPALVVPLGEKVLYTINSNDVDHGFWIPAFMIQMQALPGVTNHIEFAATKLGTFPGRCNILCGRDHSLMLFTVKVVTPAEYQSYISSLKAA